MKQLDVQIMGQSYLLGCPEGGEQRLLEAVERVDSAMCKIRDAGKVKARDRIAVLASLNLAFQMAELELRAGTHVPSASVPLEEPGAAQRANDAGPDPRLSQLADRLDMALSGDGHLL